MLTSIFLHAIAALLWIFALMLAAVFGSASESEAHSEQLYGLMTAAASGTAAIIAFVLQVLA